MRKRAPGVLYGNTKRFIDVVGAAIGLILSAPILAIACILVKLDGGPVLFRQRRVGRYGSGFDMLKLRTMVPGAHRMESVLSLEHTANGGYGIKGGYPDPRITTVGRWLRLLNIDELPQFLNILRGEMSLVGPRAVPRDESLLYGDKREEVLSVKPGLTGYWQIKRTLSTDYQERIALDCHYVRNRGVRLDAYILMLTPIAMITSDYNSVSKPLPPTSEKILLDEAKIIADVGHMTETRDRSLDVSK
jgi:exopolysaccharide production protein ExoY